MIYMQVTASPHIQREGVLQGESLLVTLGCSCHNINQLRILFLTRVKEESDLLNKQMNAAKC